MMQTKDPKININLNSKPIDDSRIKKVTVKVIVEKTYTIK